MFNRNSRYAKTKTFENAAFPGSRPRVITPTPGVIEHTVMIDDRLDRLAATYYNDSRKWWLILDANPEIVFGGDFDLRKYMDTTIVIPSDNEQGRYG